MMLKRCGHDELVECDCDAPQSPPVSAAGLEEADRARDWLNVRSNCVGMSEEQAIRVYELLVGYDALRALQSQPVGVVTSHMVAQAVRFIGADEICGSIVHAPDHNAQIDTGTTADRLNELLLATRPRADGGDGERLDWLEAEANKQGGILLHDGSETGRSGLGLRPGTLTRTLRQAIDAAMGKEAERCADCDEAAKHAYSDATTPGFFYDKCEKHRKEAATDAANG